MIKIDKGIPIPPSNTGSRYPFAHMEVGDSFFAETRQSKMTAAARNWGVRLKRKFVTRKESNGTRVWRIE